MFPSAETLPPWPPKQQRTLLSFRSAARGIVLAVRTERNLKIQIGCALAAVLAGFWLDLSTVELALIVGIIGLVLAAELLNSTIERLGDVLSGGQPDPRIRQIKDISAGAVLVAAAMSALIGAAIYLPALVRKLVR